MENKLSMKEERNYGIDLLRIISMFYILVFHCITQGGIESSVIESSIQYKIVAFLKISTIACVDIFALISGYVGYRENEERRFKASNYINLWIEVVFYTLILTAIFDVIMPNLVINKFYLLAILPVTTNSYWYFTAYTGLFLIMPILNKGIKNCKESTLKKLFLVIICIFSLYDNIANVFSIDKGYSFIWLVILYILGAIIKKCKIGEKIKTYKIILSILALYIITFIIKVYCPESIKDLYVSYTSPTILIAAILHIFLLARLKFGTKVQKIIEFASSSSFSIYLLNTNIFIWFFLIKDLFKNLYNQSVIKIIVCIFGFCILFAIVSIIIDKIRIFIFKKLKLDKLVSKLERGINILLENFLK